MKNKAHYFLGALLVIGLLFQPVLFTSSAQNTNTLLEPRRSFTEEGGGDVVDPYVPTVTFGEGVEDTDIFRAFQRFSQDPWMAQDLLYPVKSAQHMSLGSRTPWVQEAISALDNTRQYYLIYMPSEARVIPILRDLFEYADVEGYGFPLTSPTSYMKDVAVGEYQLYYIQEFDRGVLSYTFDDQGALVEVQMVPRENIPGNTFPDRQIRQLFLGKWLEYDYLRREVEQRLNPLGYGEVLYGDQLVQRFTSPTGILEEWIYQKEHETIVAVPHKILEALKGEDRIRLGAPEGGASVIYGDFLFGDPALSEKTYLVQAFHKGVVRVDEATGEGEVVYLDFASHDPLLITDPMKRSPSEGKSTVLLLRVQFPDLDYTLSEPDQFYLDAFNNEQGLTFAGYWKTASHGKLVPKVEIRTLMMPKPLRTYLKEHAYSLDEEDQLFYMTEEFATQMEYAVFAELRNTRLDWDTFDTNGLQGASDGVVDGLLLTYDVLWPQLREQKLSLYSQSGFYLDWPHAYTTSFLFPGDPVIVRDPDEQEYKIGTYSTCEWLSCGLSTFVHEFGHQLGFEDLYDRDGSTIGISLLSLMGYSHLRVPTIMQNTHYFYVPGNLPQMLDAYSRIKMGWAQVREVKGIQDIVLSPSSQSSLVYKIGEKDEYFLLENRRQEGFDAGLPEEGLAIYAVNEKKGQGLFSCLTCDEWDPGLRAIPSNGNYPLVGEDGTFYNLLFKDGYGLYPSPEGTRAPMSKVLSSDDQNATSCFLEWVFEDELFQKEVCYGYHHDTNWSDGTPSNLSIDRIDTISEYPNIKVHIQYLGSDLQYQHIINGVDMTIGQADLDGNGLVNEEDHSILLGFAQQGQRTMTAIQDLFLGLRLAVSDMVGTFQPVQTPLTTPQISVLERSVDTITLEVRTSTMTKVKIQAKSSVAEQPMLIESNIPQKSHMLSLEGLSAGEAYALQVSVENAWGDKKEVITTMSTLPHEAFNKTLSGRYLSLVFDEATPVPSGIETCVAYLNKQLGYAMSSLYFPTYGLFFSTIIPVSVINDQAHSGIWYSDGKVYISQNSLYRGSSYCPTFLNQDIVDLRSDVLFVFTEMFLGGVNEYIYGHVQVPSVLREGWKYYVLYHYLPQFFFWDGQLYEKNAFFDQYAPWMLAESAENMSVDKKVAWWFFQTREYVDWRDGLYRDPLNLFLSYLYVPDPILPYSEEDILKRTIHLGAVILRQNMLPLLRTWGINFDISYEQQINELMALDHLAYPLIIDEGDIPEDSMEETNVPEDCTLEVCTSGQIRRTKDPLDMVRIIRQMISGARELEVRSTPEGRIFVSSELSEEAMSSAEISTVLLPGMGALTPDIRLLLAQKASTYPQAISFLVDGIQSEILPVPDGISTRYGRPVVVHDLVRSFEPWQVQAVEFEFRVPGQEEGWYYSIDGVFFVQQGQVYFVSSRLIRELREADKLEVLNSGILSDTRREVRSGVHYDVLETQGATIEYNFDTQELRILTP